MVTCDSPPCCKKGFKAPLCCECLFDPIGDGESYFKQNGQCKSKLVFSKKMISQVYRIIVATSIRYDQRYGHELKSFYYIRNLQEKYFARTLQY